MSYLNEEVFNKEVADLLLPAYEKATGVKLTMESCNQDFPDIKCRRDPDNTNIGIELVEVSLSGLIRERNALTRLEPLLADAAIPVRPLFKGKVISLQIGMSVLNELRPHGFPHPKSQEAKRLAAEFAALLKVKGREVISTWGSALKPLTENGTNPPIPEMLRHFEAILINELPPKQLPSHTDDPVVDLTRATIYDMNVVAGAVRDAIVAKHRKGRSYSTDLLVLHTMRSATKPFDPGAGFHADYIVAVADRLKGLVSGQFKEVWYFDRYAGEQPPLHRIL